MIRTVKQWIRQDLAGRIEYRHFNERDIEIPALMAFLEARRGKFFSLLDIGANHSHAYYAGLIKKGFPEVVYDGVDVVPDPETEKLLHKYHVGNVTDAYLGPYDVTTCVSTLEHCGITSYRRDDIRAEQLKVFERIATLTKKYLFATFPFGQEGRVRDQYANITPELLKEFIRIAGGTARARFYYNEFPQGREKWREVSAESSSRVPVREDRGVQCVCVLEVDKPASRVQSEYHGISEFLLKKTRLIEPQPEYTPGRENYTMFNTGGVELEVGEFLYAFVKMVKPEHILETGTHLGVSAMYMAQALKENKAGRITTLEIFDENIEKSKQLWRDTGVAGFVDVRKVPSLQFDAPETYDILFLDSEPDIRFDELNRFYPKLKAGGFILIHDLHANLGLSDLFINGMTNWPFGDFREKFGHLVKDHSLQTFSFRTPRGLIIFQKADKDFSHTSYLRGDGGPTGGRR